MKGPLAGALLLALLLACGWPASASDTAGPAGSGATLHAHDNSRAPVGINLIWTMPGESMMPFIDTFKKSSPWSANTGTLDRDPQGWVRTLLPGQTATATLMMPNSQSQAPRPDKFPSGDYVVTWQGSGSLSFLGTAVAASRSEGPQRAVVTLDFSAANAGISIRLNTTDAGDPLRLLRMFMPGGVCGHDPFHHADAPVDCADGSFEPYEAVADEFVFYAPFLDNLKHFKAIRYMQSLNINGSTHDEPGDLVPFDRATWSGEYPYEVIAMLSNRLGADVWLNIPHRASNEFVEHVAQLLHTRLDPGRRVYVEFTNEVWNGVMPYAQHAQYLAASGCPRYPDLALCDNDATPGNGVLCEGWPWPNQNADCATARTRYFSDRTVEIGAIFVDVFGPARVTRVMGAWNQPNYNRALLSHNDNWQRVDALAMPTYFGGYIPSNLSNAEIIQSWVDQHGMGGALDRVFQEILDGGALRPYYLPGGQYYDPARPSWQLPPAEGALPALVNSFTAAVALAREYDVELVSYEGGPHLDVTVNQNFPAVRDVMLAANRDARMATAFRRFLDGWRDADGNLLMLYVSHSSSSGFGMVEYERQPHPPKFLAVQEFIRDNPCWWVPCAPTGVFADGFEAAP
jgi:hypothetical protein